MRVLFVNHTARISGAERSLLTLITALPSGVSAGVACPPGPLMDELKGLSVPTTSLPEIEGSLRLDVKHTPTAVYGLLSAARSVQVAARRFSADVVHANSVRAGIIAGIASAAGAPRPIVHIRDCLPEGRVTELTRGLIDRTAACIVANSRHTAERFFPASSRRRVVVLTSPVDLSRFDPERVGLEPAAAKRRLGLAHDAPVLAVVAQITPWKGQDDAIRMVARVAHEYPNVRLLLVGSAKFVSPATRYDNQSFLAHLQQLVNSLGIEQNVIFLGERPDVPEILAAVDLLLVPSWEEPFGRTVIEGLAMGLPVMATNVGGPAEVLEEGVTGALLPPRTPERWAEAALGLLAAREGPRRRAEQTRNEVRERYGAETHAREVLDIYRRLTAPAMQAA